MIKKENKNIETNIYHDIDNIELFSWQRKIIEDLNTLYEDAKKKKQINYAVQCLKTMAKLYSDFLKSNNQNNKKSEISLKDISEENLKKLIEECSQKLNNKS